MAVEPRPLFSIYLTREYSIFGLNICSNRTELKNPNFVKMKTEPNRIIEKIKLEKPKSKL